MQSFRSTYSLSGNTNVCLALHNELYMIMANPDVKVIHSFMAYNRPSLGCDMINHHGQSGHVKHNGTSFFVSLYLWYV